MATREIVASNIKSTMQLAREQEQRREKQIDQIMEDGAKYRVYLSDKYDICSRDAGKPVEAGILDRERRQEAAYNCIISDMCKIKLYVDPKGQEAYDRDVLKIMLPKFEEIAEELNKTDGAGVIYPKDIIADLCMTDNFKHAETILNKLFNDLPKGNRNFYVFANYHNKQTNKKIANIRKYKDVPEGTSDDDLTVRSLDPDAPVDKITFDLIDMKMAPVKMSR